MLKSNYLDTPLGTMIAISDDRALYLLDFINRRNFYPRIEKLYSITRSIINPGYTKPIESITNELKQYFAGTLKHFKTPLHLLGSIFQKHAWEALLCIPYGQTRSYLEQATIIGKPSAYRAVANANANNRFAIVIPCHRVINKNGKIGGYASGIEKKDWLINHEKQHQSIR